MGRRSSRSKVDRNRNWCNSVHTRRMSHRHQEAHLVETAHDINPDDVTCCIERRTPTHALVDGAGEVELFVEGVLPEAVERSLDNGQADLSR